MIKGQDVVLLVLFITMPESINWHQKQLAEALNMSSSAVHVSLKRLATSKLIVKDPKKHYWLIYSAIEEFLTKAVPYAFATTIEKYKTLWLKAPCLTVSMHEDFFELMNAIDALRVLRKHKHREYPKYNAMIAIVYKFTKPRTGKLT